MSDAQLCSIGDVYITGKSFYAGIAGVAGSGGLSANVFVVGDTYHIVRNSFRPNPSISDLTLLRQRKPGLFVNISRDPVVLWSYQVLTLIVDRTPRPST